MRRFTILGVLVLACIAAAPEVCAVVPGPDGLPRPAGYPTTPTEDYGPTPPCYLNSLAVTCDWYGFSYVLYPEMGAACLAGTRKVLANTTLAPPGELDPYTYYYLNQYVFDTTTNTSYCIYGCFDMSASSPFASPPAGFAPPPLEVSTPPPEVLDAPPPSLIAPSALPPASSTVPPTAAAVPPAKSLPPPPPPPPPPGGPRLLNLNGAGFLRPTGLVSFFISGALLILHGLFGV